jgi:hypothetical protein
MKANIIFSVTLLSLVLSCTPKDRSQENCISIGRIGTDSTYLRCCSIVGTDSVLLSCEKAFCQKLNELPALSGGGYNLLIYRDDKLIDLVRIQSKYSSYPYEKGVPFINVNDTLFSICVDGNILINGSLNIFDVKSE